MRYYLHTHKKTTMPWFEIIGVDLFADLSPQTYTDHPVWGFVIPQVEEPSDTDLVQRAQEMKQELDKGKPPAK